MYEHTHREGLTGEHRLGDIGQLLLAILFFVVWLLDSFALEYTTFLNEVVPLWVRLPLALLSLALAAYLARTGLSIVFADRDAPPGVIREGVFSWVRHPIYLGEILLYFGCLMLSISLAAAAVWMLAIVFLHAISRYEERLLVARFGEAYTQYMRDVAMWIPRRGKR